MALCTILLIGLIVLLASSSVARVNALSIAHVPVNGDNRHRTNVHRNQRAAEEEDDDEDGPDEDDDESIASWNQQDLQILRNYILKSLELAKNSRVPKAQQSPQEMGDSYQVHNKNREETERRRQKRQIDEAPIPEDIIYTYHNQGMDPPASVVPFVDNQTASWLYFPADSLANVSSVRTSGTTVVGTLQLHLNNGAGPSSPRRPVVFSVYHVSANNRLLLVDSKSSSSLEQHGDAYLMDITSSVRTWIQNPSLNLGLLLTCTHCDRLARSIVLTDPSSRPPTITTPQLVVRVSRDASQRTKRSKSLNLHDLTPMTSGRVDCERRKKGKSASRTCCRKQLNVTFAELGLHEIVFPQEFSAYYCQGKCQYKQNPASTHAVIQSMVRMNKGRHKKIPQPCCAPTRLSDLQVSYMDEKNTLLTASLKNAVVEECGCS